MDKYTKIFNLCKSLGKGREFKPLEYNLTKTSKHNIELLSNIEKVNELVTALDDPLFHQIRFTPSGSIKKWEMHHLSCSYCIYEDYRGKNKQLYGIMITVIVKNTLFRFCIGGYSIKQKINGPKSFKKFYESCKKHNIDLENYQVDNGEEVKKEIQEYKRYFLRKYHKKLIHNAHHIDYNCAWPAQVAKVYPEFTPVIEELRKKDKLIPDMALGMMQSEFLKKPFSPYSLANLAKIGINNTNDDIEVLITKMKLRGCTILGVNTDGIWYTGPVYHDSNEGKAIGQYKNDHINVDLYIWGNAQYYFIEDDKLTVKASGYYAYEQLVPREEWDHNDFITAMQGAIQITFNAHSGGFKIIQHSSIYTKDEYKGE